MNLTETLVDLFLSYLSTQILIMIHLVANISCKILLELYS